MKITYLGHSMFLVESGSTAVLIDPYDEKVGYPIPEVHPGVILVSHEHGDHNHVAMAKGHPRVIRGLADGGEWRTVHETADGIVITSVPTYHDGTKGTQRGRNTIFVLEAEGLRVVHLGDLGHPVDEATAKAIGRPDVLMIPVGGHYTIDASQARDVVARLRPAITIPMHYKTEVNAGWPIGPIDAFLAGSGKTKKVGHVVTVDKRSVPKEPEAWVMAWR
jgi:L-ascorbate metabolism protein UlaG (beta-lactamase superfamily)